MALALELQHDVDEVFEHPRAGDRAVFGHVADQHGGDAALFGDRDQCGCHLAHLRHATRRAVDVGDRHGLNRVDDQQRGIDVVEVLQDGPDVGFGREEQVRRECLDAPGPKPHLRGRLFAGDVERAGDVGCAKTGELRRDVEYQGRLADARFAGEQHDDARDQTAAEHPVEFVDAGRSAARCLGIDVTDGPRGRR